MSFCGNLDLYFNYECEGSILDAPSTKTFLITKENYFLYSIFAKLYDDIKNCNIHYGDSDTLVNEVSNSREELNSDLKESEASNPRRLFHDNMVDWHSDDYSYEETSTLTIKRLEEEIELTFNKGRTLLMPETFAVSICNNGSRHHPFNVLFMHLYHELIEYEPDFHQIHFEEILYEMKRVRKK